MNKTRIIKCSGNLQSPVSFGFLLPFTFLIILSACKGVNRLLGIDQDSNIASTSGQFPHDPKGKKHRYDIYSDKLPLGQGLRMFPRADAGNRDDLIVEKTGRAPEGNRYLTIEPASGWRRITGFYFTFGFSESELGGLVDKDLSGFVPGSLRFYLRLQRPLKTQEYLQAGVLTIDEMNTWDGETDYTPPGIPPESGFSPTSTDWQEISIPLSFRWGSANAAERVVWPFVISIYWNGWPDPAPEISFDVDDVHWQAAPGKS